MSRMPSLSLNRGIRLAREGHQDLAAGYLARAVQENPHNETAWLWLAACLEDLDQQRYCLGRAVVINPNNLRARRALERLSRPGWGQKNTSASLERTQPVRVAAGGVPVTSGALTFEAPARLTGPGLRAPSAPTLENYPVRSDVRQKAPRNATRQTLTARLGQMNRAQLALLAAALLLLFFSLAYWLWTLLAPGVSPREVPAVTLSLISDRARMVRPGDDLQQAITEAAPGTAIRLAAGVYRLQSPLHLSQPVKISGAGMDSTYLISDQPGPMITIQGSGLFRIERLEIRHEGAAPADVLVMEGGVLELSNCRVVGGITDETGGGGRGLVLRGVSAGSIDTCEVLDNQGHGIELAMQATTGIRYSAIHHNGGSGVLVSGETRPRLEENVVAENGWAGIEYADQSAGQALHNETRGNAGSGVEIRGAAAPVLSENASMENTENGIRVSGEARPVLLENQANRNQQAGLAYFDRAGGAAEKNQCNDNLLHGISVNDSAEPFLVENQCNRNRQVGIDYWGVSGGVARANECAENGLQGIAVHESAGPVLEQNICRKNRDSGIIYWDQAGGEARGNICSDNGIHGISLHDQAGPTLEGNRCEGNGAAGIQYSDASRGLARENVCASNGSDRVILAEQTRPVLENNQCDD